MKQHASFFRSGMAMVMLFVLAACDQGIGDLQQFVNDTKANPPLDSSSFPVPNLHFL